MASEVQAGPPLVSKRYGDSLCTSVAGSRDCLIIASLTDPPPSSDVVPRRDFEPTEQDRRRLTNQLQGVQVESYDDLSVMRARIAHDEGCRLVGEEVSRPGEELTRGHVLERLKSVLTNCTADGAVVHYFGNGKRNTGDWCFHDGFITFKDIASLYLECFSGRVLTITSDCSHSGSWVRASMEFLDEQGVQPCGHSATKKGIFLKVYASCKSHETAAVSCFGLRTAENDKNTTRISYNFRDAPQPTQHPCGYDFTFYRCKADKPEEPCTFSADYTWHKRSQGQRIYLVRGKDKGRPAWHYVLVVDDDKTIDRFVELTQGENAGHCDINIEDFGQVLKSGFGNNPPDSIKEWIKENY